MSHARQRLAEMRKSLGSINLELLQMGAAAHLLVRGARAHTVHTVLDEAVNAVERLSAVVGAALCFELECALLSKQDREQAEEAGRRA